MEAVIETRNLTKRYRDVMAVDGLDLTVGKGSLSALLGGNGASFCCLKQYVRNPYTLFDMFVI